MALFGLGKKRLQVRAPFAGDIVRLEEVADPVFSGGMLGPGFALVPPPDAALLTVAAPVAGKLVKVFKTGHAFAIVTDAGVEVLVHIGLDTVARKGAGFEALAATGDRVAAGAPVIRVDAADIRAAGCDLVTPVVFTKRGQVAEVAPASGPIGAGEVVCTVTLA